MASIIKKEINVEELHSLIPNMGAGRHKGQNGKIGIIGGSFEYTGAPYYVGAAVLRGGGDLSHIFCTEKAATAIKSYSPEIIVHPYLLSEQDLKRIATKEEIKNCVDSITEWYKPLHAVSMGSGLGRDNAVSEVIEDLFSNLKELITVCDGDFFYFLTEKNKESLAERIRKRSKYTVLTPNKVEFQRIWKFLKGDQEQTSEDDIKEQTDKLSESKAHIVQLEIDNPLVKDQVEISKKLHNVTILMKGQVDVITNGKEAYVVKKSGCFKRCGGQGDVMSGLTALYCYWESQEHGDKQLDKGSEEFSLVRGCMLASYITRYSAALAYEKYRYGLTTPHILEEVHNAINDFVDKGLV